MLKLFWLLVLFSSSSSYALNVAIPSDYQDKISAVVINAQTGKTVYSYNNHIPRLVASNVKLVTTLAALNQLHADFHWHTKLSYSGTITADGVLDGNIYLVGGGDPTL